LVPALRPWKAVATESARPAAAPLTADAAPAAEKACPLPDAAAWDGAAELDAEDPGLAPVDAGE